MKILALIAVALLAQAKAGGGGNVSFDDKVLATIPDDTKISDAAFSPDGRQVAYKAFKGTKFFVGVNNTKGPDFAGVENLKWSSTGKLAYRAFNGTTWCVVVGGQAGPSSFSVVGEPIWSPDGSKVAYEIGRASCRERV